MNFNYAWCKYKNLLLALLHNLKINTTSLLFGCLLIGSSCSLKPVYSSKHNAKELAKLSSIEIQPINSVEGSEFLYHFSRILPCSRGIKPQYLLKVEFSNTKVPSVLQRNSDTIREAINQTVSYSLMDALTNKEVTSGRFKHITSYNTNSTVYTSYIIGEGEMELLTNQAAEEIRKRLILYFKRIEDG